MNNDFAVFSCKLLEQQNPAPVLERLLESLGGLKTKVSCGDLVLIKPNFVAPFPTATTDLAFIDFFIHKIREAGAIPVVGESSGYEFDTEKTLEILGIRTFLGERRVDMLNLEDYGYVRIELGAGLPSVEVARMALEAKLIINLPVLKGHSITKITGAVKNFFGLLSKSSRRKLHCHRLHDAIARLPIKFENVLHFVDARKLLTRAVFGETKPLDFCLAGRNPFTLDHFGSKLLRICPDSVRHLQHVPEYELHGVIPQTLHELKEMESLKDKFHRMMYSVFYWLDEAKSRALGGKSIIPYLHWNFGVHPVLNDLTSVELRRLAELCPIGAIDVYRKKIIREKCVMVRCLKCFRDGPPGSVSLKGINSPKDKKSK